MNFFINLQFRIKTPLNVNSLQLFSADKGGVDESVEFMPIEGFQQINR